MLDKQLIKDTIAEIGLLRDELLGAREKVAQDHPRYQSRLNLEQYMILRSQDRTELQEKLFLLSLSSLGRSYAHVAASIDTLYDQLSCWADQKSISSEEMESFRHISIQEAISKASINATDLFGGLPAQTFSKQKTAVMVTLPSHAAENKGALIYELAAAGVQVLRINTAHDSLETWRAMADVISTINESRNKEDKIRIFVDLAGPKIRTGSIQKLSLPVKIGSNKRPSEVLLISQAGATTFSSYKDRITMQKMPAQISINTELFRVLKEGKKITLYGVNGSKASMEIVEVSDGYAMGVINKKIYLDEFSTIEKKDQTSAVLNIIQQMQPIRLFTGDTLVLTEQELLGHATIVDEEQNLLKPATISCSFNGISSMVALGDPIFIDDGKISLEVVAVEGADLICKVTNAKLNGVVLKEEKGINFPETIINTGALTHEDKSILDGVLEFADLLGVSFCQSAEDLKELQDILRTKGCTKTAIVPKIETKHAVQQMPNILRQLLEWEHSGVMIARGDLAIEVGFANMASIQEKLLDICDAAHIPVIWATQVLEGQMKNNLPSRAEVTDAAMSGRAECVMLNKGMFAAETINILRHILHGMHLIFKKNRQLLNKETIW